MKVRFDVDKCESFAACVVAAPEVFDFDDDENVAILINPHPPIELLEQVRAAVRNCPVQAISMSD